MSVSFSAKEQDPEMMACIAVNILGLLALVTFSILYLLKSGLGIKLFSGSHVLDFLT